MRGRLIVLTVLALLVPAGAASAHQGTSQGAPARGGSMKLCLEGVYFVSHQAVTVPGRPMQVHGAVWPFVRGQKVTLVASIGHSVIGRYTTWIYPSKNGRYGIFTKTFKTGLTGAVTVTAVHSKNTRMKGFG